MSISASVYKLVLLIFRIIPFRNAVLLILRRFNLMPEKLQCDIRYNGTFNSMLYNYKIILNNAPEQTIENQIFWKGEKGIDERFSLKLWTILSQKSKVILDIGANTGIYSILAGVANREAQIYSFEPSPEIYLKLKRNIELNRINVNSYEMGVSNCNGRLPFYDFKSEHQYSASLCNELYQDEYTNVYEVTTTSLDCFINEKNLSEVDLIKIDVEMHEPAVIEGFANGLTAYKPAVFIEILSDNIGHMVLKYFEPLGYLFFDIDEQKGLIPVTNIKKATLYNYFLCTKDFFEYHNLRQYVI